MEELSRSGCGTGYLANRAESFGRKQDESRKNHEESDEFACGYKPIPSCLWRTRGLARFVLSWDSRSLQRGVTILTLRRSEELMKSTCKLLLAAMLLTEGLCAQDHETHQSS